MTENKYIFLEKLGAGGFAEVFRAKIQGVEGFEKPVAIKRLHSHLTRDPEVVQMIVDEAKILSNLNHPNIVQVYNFEKMADQHLLIMEYVAGYSLSKLLSRLRKKKQRLEIGLIAYIAEQIAQGLAYAHQLRDASGTCLGIVHRDISPQNILVSEAGMIKITDFGIAKASFRASQTQAGLIKGKFAYVSPEQAKGQSVDPRSDLFSLGVVIYEMLFGLRLFQAPTDSETIHTVLNWLGISPQQLNILPEDTPRGIMEVLIKSLEPQPQHRYQSASDLLKDLQKLRQEMPGASGSNELSQLVKLLFEGEQAEATPGIEPVSGDRANDKEEGRVITSTVTMDGRKNLQGPLFQIAVSEEPTVIDIGSTTSSETTATTTETTIPPTGAISFKKNSLRQNRKKLLLGFMLLLVIGTVGLVIGFSTDKKEIGQRINDLSIPDLVTSENKSHGVTPLEIPEKKPGNSTPEEPLTETPPIPEKLQAAPQSESNPNSVKHVRSKKESRHWGTLKLNSDPWAYVEIDGKLQKKTTPLSDIKLPEGNHTIRLFNPVVKRSKTFQVTIQGGRTSVQVITF